MRKVIKQKFIKRSDLRNNRDKFYLFGDNLAGFGLGGQAREMRGEPNAIGIPTKRKPSMERDAFFSDDHFDFYTSEIDKAFEKIPLNATVIIPADGIGTGFASLEKTAPKVFKYLQDKLKSLALEKKIDQVT